MGRLLYEEPVNITETNPMNKLPNKINETYPESCERKAKVLDAFYSAFQNSDNPVYIAVIKALDELNAYTIKEDK